MNLCASHVLTFKCIFTFFADIIKDKVMSNQIKLEAVLPENERENQLSKQQNSFDLSAWNKGHWSQEQNVKCISFFQFNRHQLHSKLKIKQNKFFKQMSMFIETRNPIQCRSQCHKLLRKHKTFYNAIANFKEESNLQQYDAIYKIYSKNDLIRFKEPEEQQLEQKRQKCAKTMQRTTQTEKSYLFKKYLQNAGERMDCIKEGRDLLNYPFFRFGWWM